MHTLGLCRLSTFSTMALTMLASALPLSAARAEPRAAEFTLSNGMEVVVIPDHRAPVVTHMVW
jgi:zinc protease